MEINKRNRTELKSFFKADEIPTQKQFEQFIDAGLNQMEDGIARAQDGPLALQAEGEAVGTQEILNLFSDFDNDIPDWSLNLNPRVDPQEPGSNHPGLNIKDVTGESRLFISSENGSIGLGTIEPEARLTIQGTGNGSLIAAIADTEERSRVFEITQEGGDGILSLRGNNPAPVTRLSGSVQKPSFFLGNVGIGAENPEAPLHISSENAELRIATTSSDHSLTACLRLAHGNKYDSSWEVFIKQGLGKLEFIPIADESKKLIMRSDGVLEVPGGVWVGTANRPDHLDGDGTLYRHNDQVYLTVDDHFYIRRKNNGAKMHLETINGRIAVGGVNPAAPLSISGSGKERDPGGSIHITSQCILFGGNNAGKQTDSAQISAGKHAANSLNIVGMASGTGSTDRKVDIYAEGGLTVRGPLYLNNYLYNPVPVMFSAYLASNQGANVDVLNFNRISNNFGDAYSAGRFTAPVKGLYMFTITFRAIGSAGWAMHLDPADGGATTYLNGNNQGEQMEKSWLNVHANQYGSRTVFTQLNAGDQVFVSQTAAPSNGADNYSSGFEGMLVYALPD